MKKIFAVAVVALGAAFGANAQETFAPKAGDFSVELQFNPFSNDFETFKIDCLQGRYFFGNQDALRFGIGFGLDSHKDNQSATNDNLWTKTQHGMFNINLGYERHFFNYKRVDLYAGAGLGFALETNKKTRQFEDPTEEILRKEVVTNSGDSFSEFYGRVFTGIDFYVYKGLYVGAELGLKVGAKHFPGEKTKGGYDQGKWSDSFEVEGTGSSDFLLELNALPALRLGWTF